MSGSDSISSVEINSGDWLYRMHDANSKYLVRVGEIKDIWDENPEVYVPVFYNRNRKKKLRSLGWEHTSLCDYETLCWYGLISEVDKDLFGYWDERYKTIRLIFCALKCENTIKTRLSLGDFYLLNRFLDDFGGKG